MQIWPNVGHVELSLFMWGRLCSKCGGQSVGKGRRRLGDCVAVALQECVSGGLLLLASAECLFPRLEWHSSGRPVARLPSFLQAVHGLPESERGMSHACLRCY